MNNIQRIETTDRMSQAVCCNGLVFLAGQVARDVSLDLRGQTRQVLENIDRLLEQAGSDKTRILSATVWLPNIAMAKETNAEWDAWVPAGHAPARACVEARLVSTEYLVEIGIVAAAS